MKLKTVLLTALATFLIPAFVQAQSQSISGDQDQQRQRPSGEERGERFANTDTNGDEQLSREEIESAGGTRLLEHFDKIDTNGDGQLSKDELKAAHKKRGKGKGKGGPQGGKGKGGSCTDCEDDA